MLIHLLPATRHLSAMRFLPDKYTFIPLNTKKATYLQPPLACQPFPFLSFGRLLYSTTRSKNVIT